jgi:hypothetical protein
MSYAPYVTQSLLAVVTSKAYRGHALCGTVRYRHSRGSTCQTRDSHQDRQDLNLLLLVCLNIFACIACMLPCAVAVHNTRHLQMYTSFSSNRGPHRSRCCQTSYRSTLKLTEAQHVLRSPWGCRNIAIFRTMPITQCVTPSSLGRLSGMSLCQADISGKVILMQRFQFRFVLPLFCYVTKRRRCMQNLRSASIAILHAGKLSA